MNHMDQKSLGHKLNQRLDKWFTSDQFTWPTLRKMFLTLLLDQFFIYFINVMSTMLVSRVGEAAMAAVSLVSTVNGMVSLVFSSLATGGGIVVARAKGRGDAAEIRQAIGEVTGVCFLTALVLSAVMFTAADSVVHVLYPDVEPLVTEYAVRYMRMMCVSFIPFSIFNAVFNIFRSLGDTRSSLFLTIVINVAHLLLSLVFINGLGMGVEGAGLSYIIARTVGMALALIWVLKVHNTYGVEAALFFRFKRKVTRELFSLGMPLAVESMLLQGGMLLVNIYVARLSTMEMAAHARANSILNLYNVTAGALTALTSTVCGQCFGAGRKDLMMSYGKHLIRAGRFAMGLTSMIMYPLTPLLLLLFCVPEESRGVIFLCLGIAAVAMPLFACDSNLTAMILRVAGDSGFTGFCAVSALALGRCALGYVLTIPLGLGITGDWIALAFEWCFRTVLQRRRMKGTRWLAKKDI